MILMVNPIQCIRLLLVLAPLASGTGCATLSLYASNHDYALDAREIGDAPGVLGGVYAGTVVRDGTTYHCLRFEGALRGDERVLDVLVPDASGAGAGAGVVLLENDEPLEPGGEPAAQLMLRYCDYSGSDPAVSALQEAMWIASPGPPEELRARDGPAFGVLVDSTEEVFAEPLGIGFTRREDMAKCRVWSHPPGGPHVLAADIQEEHLSRGADLRWRERSAVVYVLRSAGYVVTVPVDVALLPVYCAVAALNAIIRPLAWH